MSQAESLLEQIAEQALDDDYYLVQTERPSLFARSLTGAALGVFALLITVAAVQTRIDRPASDRQQQALAADVENRRQLQAAREASVEELGDEVAGLTAAADRDDPALQALLIRTAGSPVRGPGIVVRLTPAATDGGAGDVTDTDLQLMANALWYLGAEAIAVNGQRIGTMTSIRKAGDAITVNYTSINPPYVVEAIGDADRLRDRLEGSRTGQDWQSRSRTTGLGFRITDGTDLRLAAISDGRQRVTHADPAPEEDQ